ncbi:MAG TPA: acyl carrier protein, partial [Candidatus Bathyarchaeia archaeon]|nr:acyl carrier protein [Candidatus Bathyarchaeia archaeon]
MNTEERVKKVIEEQLSVNQDQITREASFIDDLGAD